MRTVIFKSCFKDDMQSFMEHRVATFAWNTYRLDNYRLSSFERYLTKISYNDEIVPQTIINQWLNDVGRILRTFKIKKNVEVTDNGKIII